MNRVTGAGVLAIAVFGLFGFGCGEDQKTAERPKDVGYVAPEVPVADGGAPAAKTPATKGK